jgi:hypothetical protein
MARSNSYAVGNTPPEVVWTVVRGDTASFRVYATDDAKLPLVISDWTIKMDIKRGSTLILNLFPEQTDADNDGEFTVFLNSDESEELETGDIFDIQLSDDFRVWTIARGSMVIIEDVTD